MTKNYLNNSTSRFAIIYLILLNIGFSQKTYGFCDTQSKLITFSAQNIPLSHFFSIINEQTGLLVVNNAKETNLDEDKVVSVNFSKTKIQDVMNFLLTDKTELGFYIEGNEIIIYRDKHHYKFPNSVKKDTSISEQIISGKVTDHSGNAIPGATIKTKNGKFGTISDSDGTFQLKHVKRGDIISISSIGFETEDVEIRKGPIVAALRSYTNNLDEKVVLAYGHTTKRFNTGNIGAIKATDIEKQPVNNPILAIEGRIAGVFIEQASGLPGTGVKIAIQGQNSIMNGNDPFYVIDGVPYISQLMQPPVPGITAGSSVLTGNPLNFINPSDIESIEILKDADATAIYGSRAANGAVLITTKKGKSGSMRTNFNIQRGWGEVGHKLQVLNAQEYLAMRREALKNDGITGPSDVDYDLNGTWDTTQVKDWQNELIGGSAQYTDIQLGFSGGTDQTQYLISGGYHKETTVFPGDFSDVKGSIHFNIRSSSSDQKFRIQMSGSYMRDKNLLPTTDLTLPAIQLAPVAPNPLNPDGSLNWAPSPSGASTYLINPLTYLKRRYSNKTNNLTSQSTLSYDIYSWLTIKSSFGYNNLTSNEISINPLSAMEPESRNFNVSSSTFGTTNMYSWVIEPGIELNRKIYQGKLNIFLGATFQNNYGRRIELNASGFTNDLLLEDIKSAPQLLATQSVDYTYKYSALYSRINYNFDDKYIVNFTARRDGSSRFGPQNQFHNFGAIGAAWIFSQTSTIQKYLPFISFGKIRASYGVTGNDQIGDYRFLDLYDIIPAEEPYQQSSLGLAPNRLTTPDLQWEETKKIQIGLELGFFKDRILIVSNYNRNRSSNQLIGISLPYITGFPGIDKNFDALVQNKGWEFTLNATNIRTKSFTWTSSINLTIPKNKLVSYAYNNNVSYIVGQSITSRPVSRLAGVNDSTGKFEFIDSKGNLTSLPTDFTKYIYMDPEFYGGFQNNFSFKEFTLDFLLQFVKRTGQDLTYGYSSGAAGNFRLGANNQPITILNRWKKPGDNASQPKFTTSRSSTQIALLNARQSDATYVDASYIRLKNISLSWQMPETMSKKLKLKNLRLYTLAQNLFTITNYFGLDPESRGVGLPPLRVITFGAQIAL
ncbi:SusC/RagA family TonB-linked outer membrane protein [Chitinophaga polysaccharea]|uniref:SusC/RagA family TonB-linked outer membrane protein n=1 Tax=Chitinophaga polysaccharea TaxID=1293035 RepID=UPI00115AB8DC|nr:SusC/RagA family TonB-linked outer membrane protein [Chitinophaga polysaccharea]